MRIRWRSESIEVAAAAVQLNTDDATVGTVIENRRIVDLPLNGRDYLQLVALSPNISFGALVNARRKIDNVSRISTHRQKSK